MKIKRTILGIWLVLCLLIGEASWLTMPAAAADTATLTITGGTCTVGETISVKVKVSAPETIGMVDFTLVYDASLLTYTDDSGANGAVRIIEDGISSKSETFTYKFKAKKAGTATLKATSVEILRLDPSKGDEFDKTEVVNGKVTINPPYEASTNAYLKKLAIGEGTISPSFSKDKYEYSAEVSGKHSSVTVTATAEDKKAKVSVSGNRNLKEGDNTVKIVVTAEDGKTTKTYTIKVKRGAVPTNTPTPTPSPSASPTPGLTVPIGGEVRTLSDEITQNLPDGFSAETEDFDGFHVAVASDEDGTMKLVQMDDGKLYVMDDSAGEKTYYPLRTIESDARRYICIEKPAGEVVPDGFTEESAELFGGQTTVYRMDADGTLCLVYLRNPSGGNGWYLYDTEDGTVQRFHENAYRAPSTQEPTPTPDPGSDITPTVTPGEQDEPTGALEEPGETPTPTGEANSEAAPTRSADTKGGGLWALVKSLSNREQIGAAVIAGLLLLSIILFVLLILSGRRRKRESRSSMKMREAYAMDETFDPRLFDDDEEEPDDEDDDDY